MTRRLRWLAVAAILCLPLVNFAIKRWGPEPVVDFESKEWKARAAILSRSQVFVKDPPVISTLDLSKSPNDPEPLDPDEILECRYISKPLKATTPKFYCELPDGDEIKVKYGATRERSGEVAASRLLAALGFGTDHVTMIPRIRCTGCPFSPFEMLEVAESFFVPWIVDFITPRNQRREFEWVAVERKRNGRSIEVKPHEGWDWDELSEVDPAKGGATKPELDALRLMAVFLSHWDNKATNQRLVCEDREGKEDDPLAPCASPLLMLQDVGSTFGPGKVKHAEWTATPIWAKGGGCVATLDSMPYNGGRFKPTRISEEGRRLLADKLTQFSDAQVRALFEAARFPDPVSGEFTGDVMPWVQTFKQKVRLIADRSCPPLST
jgi:hypothetical protein